MSITTESLRAIGFVSSINFGSKKSNRSELNWKGAPVWWDGQYLYHQRDVLNLETTEQVVEYIKSLKIKPGRGKKIG